MITHVLISLLLGWAAQAASLGRPQIAAVAKGPNQINLTWGAVAEPGYGYLVEVSGGQWLVWTELKPIPVAAGYSGDPAGVHVYNPPVNGVATWVVEPQYLDPQDGTPTQFIAAGLRPGTVYRFRVRCYRWLPQPEYGPYSNVVAATTMPYAARYVSLAGSDAADGSPAHPWRTLAHGSAAIQCGQVLVAAPGSYVNDSIAMAQVCSNGKAVVMAEVSGSVVVQAPAGAANAITLSGSGLVVDGIAVRTAAGDYEVLVGGSHNALLRTETANGWGVHLVHADCTLIYQCYLHDAGSTDNGNGGFTLAVEHSTNHVVWSNHLTRGAHDVSLCKQTCTGGNWLTNVMDGGWGMGFEAIEQSVGNLVEGNTIWHVQQLMGTTYKPGIEISSAQNIVRRNLVIGGKSTAVEVSALYGGDSAQGVKVYNNTLAGNYACLFQSANDGGGMGAAAYNGFEFKGNVCTGFLSKAIDIYLANVESQVTGNDLSNADGPAAKSVIWNHVAQGSYQYPRTVSDADATYSPPFSNNVSVPARYVDEAGGDYHLQALKIGAYGPLR
jgi:hypothetical protein